ncbi:hypothetical protein ACTJJ0_05400 [Chitinophaga sp. 22321]|uniref:Uncharacterized protein n=1 Tax=Chitinophaga hostae TaxID=2831022 RepID=A0ABS5IZB0_9BACT|nr:hypothetical protein [Chitinophaga hostae]MBS0028308.1 hypothetical protein [Chitinophaga hostae]
MIRFLLIAALLAVNTSVCHGQLSVYFCYETREMGWSVGFDNTNGTRDNEAYKHCLVRGGKYPAIQFSNNSYGCYAVVSATDDTGVRTAGWAAGESSEAAALNAAKAQARSKRAVESSIHVLAVGCVAQPPKQEPQWGEWHSEACSYLEYRIKTLEGFDWNYQVHAYIQVRSRFKMPVTFVFELLDKDGKVHFGDLHKTQPGETIEFVHKMQAKIIKRIRITDLKNANTNRTINCDDADGGRTAGSNANNENLQQLVAEFNNLLPQIPDGQNKTNIYNSTLKVLTGTYDDAYKASVVKDAINRLKGLPAQSVSKPDLSAGINELSQKELSLINDIREIEPNANVSAWEGERTDNAAYIMQRKKENVSYLENYLGKLETKAAGEKAAKERQKNTFNGLMQKGNEAMNRRDYTLAMSNYQAAVNSTSDINDQNLARDRYNAAMEAKKTADRQVRVANAHKTDNEEDMLYTTAAASAAGFMALLKDGYSSRSFAAKFLLGVGYEHAAILSNGVGKSYIEERDLFSLHTGFNLGFFNNKPVSFYVKPMVNMGMSAFTTGVSGGYASYGGTGVLQLAVRRHSKFNIFAEGGWFKHSGTYKYDADARNNTATDDVREGNMSFSRLLYGGGLMLRWINTSAGKETYIRPAVYYEKPSFFTDDRKPVLSMNLQVYIYSAIMFDFTYTPNTYVSGELHYPATLEMKEVNAYSIKIIRLGRLY